MKNGTHRLTIHEVSGGFATVQPDSQLSINAVEGFPLEDFSAEAVRNQIQEAQKVAGGSGSEQDIAEAKIELEVRFVLALSILFTQRWILCAKLRSKQSLRY